jgi:hypothetical protein
MGVAGALSDTAQDWRNKCGLTGLDSDLQREIRSHPRWPTEWIARLFASKYKVTRFEEQLSEQTVVEFVAEERGRAFAAMWQPRSYSEEAVSDEKWESDEYVLLAAATEIPAPDDIEGPTSDYTKYGGLNYIEGEGQPPAYYVTELRRRGWKRFIGYKPADKPSFITGSIWNDRVWHQYERRTRAFLKWMGRQRYVDWLIARSKDTYYEVRDGQLIEPNTIPAPFESKVTIYYRGTPLAAVKLIAVVQAESVRHSTCL